MKSKILLLTSFAMLLATITTVSIASAARDNVTPVTSVFITIDPIGNHRISEVFFINGTTDLAVSQKLTMNIVSLKTMDPHMKTYSGPYPGEFAYDIPVISIPTAAPGTNRWSANVTDIVKKLKSGEYLVEVFPQINPCGTLGCLTIEGNYSQIFSLFSANNGTTLVVLQTTAQSPSPIQTTTRAVTTHSTTQSSSLSLALPIAILAAIVILKSIHGKKRD